MRKLLLVLGILCLLTIPYPVQAVSTVLTVTGEGAYTNGVYVGGAGDFTNMNSNDGDTSYIYTTTGSLTHFWTMSTLSSVSTINSVQLAVSARAVVDSAYVQYYVRIGGVNYGGSQSLLYPAYGGYAYTWTTNPATGLAWTISDINNAQWGFTFAAGALGDECRVSYMYLAVDSVATSPSMSTSPALPISVTTATLNGAITSTNGANADYEGFVFDTGSHTVTANVTPPNGYASNITVAGNFTAGTFAQSLTGLVSGQSYYFRSYAHNTYGWNYGAELSFATVGTPSVSTQPATYLSPTTAQLNGLVVNSGNQLCDLRFGYGTTSRAATLAGFNGYDVRTVFVNDTYNTGDTPMVSIGSLTVGTLYYYNVQIENDAGIAYGIEGAFTTTTGLNPPTAFVAIPSVNSIVLTWNKDVTSPLTEVRYSSSTYPNTTADGALCYLGPLSSTTVSNLTIGTNYFFSAWGSGGGLFSTSKVTTLGTTTAGLSPTTLIPPAVTTSMWVAMPSELGLANIPIYSYFNWAFDSYSMPRATGWVILFMFLILILGMLVYMKAPSNNLLLTGVFVGIMLSWGTLIGMPNHCLIPIWATFAYWVVFLALTPVMNRY
jgi:hypothetical protein